MAYINLLDQLPHNGTELFKNLENSSKELINLKKSKAFNEVCLKEDICQILHQIILRLCHVQMWDSTLRTGVAWFLQLCVTS